MSKLSYGEQADIISKILKMEIDRLKSLPVEEAKKEAHRGLMEIGFIDNDGNVTEPYVALRNEYV